MAQPLYPRGYPRDGSYADLLLWHLYVWGTRPGGSTTVRADCAWEEADFIKLIFKGLNTSRPKKTYEAWFGKGRCAAPGDKFGPLIAAVLFNEEPQFATWEIELEEARQGSLGQNQNVKSINVEAAIAELETATLAVSSIPQLTPHFIGRDATTDALAKALIQPTGTHAILVHGGPGMGKTELTKAVAGHPKVVAHFVERRWFIRLETATTAQAMKDAIIQQLGCDPKNGFDGAIDMLSGSPALLVLDNLETPWESIAERAATERMLADLAAVQGVALLASLRGQEWMKQPKWLSHPLLALSREDATALFAAIAGSWIREDQALDDFLTALGGLPLAIELVARRAYGRVSLAPLWAEWNRIGAELARHTDFAAGRLTSLPHSIELSLQSSRATPEALRLFSLLGCLPAGLSAQDLTALMADDAYAAEERLLALGLAVERPGRITLLPPIREHAARRYPPGAVGAPQWGTHFWEMTVQFGNAIGTTAIENAVQRLEAEFANIEACLREMLRRNLRYEAVSTLPGLVRLVITRSLDDKVIQEVAARCEQENELLDWAHCLAMLGDIARARSRYEIAENYYKRSCALYESLQYALGEANCRQGIARIALELEDVPAAQSEYEKLIPIYRRIVDKLGEANCTRALGDIAARRSDPVSARGFYDRARALYVDLDYILGQAHCVKAIGNMAFDSEDFELARAMFEDAHDLYVAVDNTSGQANCIKSIGDIALRFARIEQARASYVQAIALYRKTDDAHGKANCMVGLGDIALREGQYREARKYYKNSLAIYEKTRDKLGLEVCIRKLDEI